MTTEEEEEIYAEAIRTFGEEFQFMVFNEELAELIVAVSHYRRKRVSAESVLEEISDVQIMINQLVKILDGSDDHATIARIKNEKLERLKKRLEKVKMNNKA